jgi:hypothetical protein
MRQAVVEMKMAALLLAATFAARPQAASSPNASREFLNHGKPVVEQLVGGDQKRRPTARRRVDIHRRSAAARTRRSRSPARVWIRFYTLDGFGASEDRGWHQNYNFGSGAAVRERCKAAVQAGVDLIATDQYEELRDFLRE